MSPYRSYGVAPAVCLNNPHPHDGEESSHVFAYDHLYTPTSTSEQVFTDLARPLVEGLFDGYNATIRARHAHTHTHPHPHPWPHQGATASI